MTAEKGRLAVDLMDGGLFVVMAQERPKRVTVNGKVSLLEYAAASGRVTVAVEERGMPCYVEFQIT